MWGSDKNEEKINKNLAYLEEERKKLWAKIISVEEEFKKKTPEYLAEAKQSSKKSSEFRNRCEEAKEESLQNLNETKGYLDAIKEKFADYDNIYSKILIINESCSDIDNKTKLFLEEIENRKIEIENNILTLENLFSNHQLYIDKINKLEILYEKSDDTSNKIEILYKNISARKKEMDELYYEIIGYTETDEDTKEETEVDGLKGELEKIYDNLKNSFSKTEKNLINLANDTESKFTAFTDKANSTFEIQMNNYKTQFVDISNKIENLLPNALTAGLSHAYSEKKTSEETNCKNLEKSFKWSIAGMIIISIIPFAVSIALLFDDKSLHETILNMPRLVLSIMPLYIPVLWVAYSSNKNFKLSKRLIEEYTHKEVLSKTFEGLSRQIENINNEDISSELRTKLLYNILEVSAENPGKLISDYNKSDHPLMDALDKSVKLADAVDKLSRIPGFTKLANKLEKRSNEILDEKAKVADEGLKHV